MGFAFRERNRECYPAKQTKKIDVSRSMKKLFTTVFACAVLSIAVEVSQATPIPPTIPGLWIIDTTGSGTAAFVADSGGSAYFTSNLGSWSLAITVGQTIVPGANPQIDLNVAMAKPTAGAGNLLIYYSDNNFGPSAGSVAISTTGGGINGGGVTTSVGYDSANTLFALTSPLVDGSGLTANSPYALTIEDQITPGTPGVNSVNSVDTSVSVPDGGTTVGLLGLALMGIAGVRRKLNA